MGKENDDIGQVSNDNLKSKIERDVVQFLEANDDKNHKHIEEKCSWVADHIVDDLYVSDSVCYCRG